MTEKTTLSNRLEDAFLAILRVVILIVLAVSLVGAAILGITGVGDLTAKPAAYEAEKIDKDDFRKKIEAVLSDNEARAPQAGEKRRAEVEEPENKALEEEIQKQIKLRSDFLSPYGYSFNVEFVGESLMNASKELASDDSAQGVAAYAKGRTDVYVVGYTDPTLLELVQKKQAPLDHSGFDDILKRYDSLVASYYDDFYRQQAEKKEKFEIEEAAAVIGKQAGAMQQLYTAGGLFGAFLLISLILVLVKIERNLRSRPL